MAISSSNNMQQLLHQSLHQSSNRSPEKTAVMVGGRSYSYSELLESAVKLSNSLVSFGLCKGDRCVIYMDNTWPCIVSIYAVLMAGGVFVNVNPQTKRDKLQFILNDSSARIIISDPNLCSEFYEVVDEIVSLKSVIVTGDNSYSGASKFYLFDNAVEDAPDTYVRVKCRMNDLSALIYTSGSTGSPKGVMHTHSSMTFAMRSIIEYLRLSSEDKILVVLPLAFDYGLYQLLMSVHLGATLILEKSFTYPAQIFKRIKEEAVTVFPGVPTIFSMLLSIHKRNEITFSSVKKITNTAAALPPEYVGSLKEVFPSALIYNMYGLTECKRVCYLEPEKIDTKPSSVGKAIPRTDVFILDEKGREVRPGEVGKLYVRGAHIMQGYWKHKELSEEVLIDAILPGERVLCTNDWFKMDEDGDLYFLGRSDDIIKTRGEKVSPLEVENLIYGIEGVLEAAVIGIEDEVLGEAIKCFVVIEKGSDLTLKQIKKVCTQKLENFMVPKYFCLVDTLPKTNTGKIIKKNLE